MKRCVVLLVWAVVFCSLPSVVFAGSGAVPSDSELVFKMLCTTLVIFMALPGIVLFYGGMVQKKNVLSVFARCIVMTALVSVLWLVFGYNFTFLPNASWLNAIIGHFSFIGIQHASFYPPSPATASNMIDMIYQMGFAIIAVVIIVGGFAERMRFSATMLFTPFWLLLCYCPIAHWVWGGGWLSQLGALDFAGGTVVHINAGVAGLVAALMVKQRQKMTYQPNSLVLVTIGTSIIWIGWFGFDAGSANSILYGLLALINTHVAAASAALGWLTIEWVHHRKPTARGLLFGAIAGLVAITPAAGYCSPVLAVVIGFIAGGICYWASYLKHWFHYDDALDAFGLHGVGGIVGSLLTGVVVSKALGGVGYASGMTWYAQLGIQALGIIATIVWSAFWTFVILWCIQKFHGLRVSQKAECEGLDASEHGEALS